MTEQTTSYRWSQQLYSMQQRFDKMLANNPSMQTLPPLYADDYDVYLKAVLKFNPLHTGAIYYKGREIRKMGAGK